MATYSLGWCSLALISFGQQQPLWSCVLVIAVWVGSCLSPGLPCSSSSFRCRVRFLHSLAGFPLVQRKAGCRLCFRESDQALERNGSRLKETTRDRRRGTAAPTEPGPLSERLSARYQWAELLQVLQGKVSSISSMLDWASLLRRTVALRKTSWLKWVIVGSSPFARCRCVLA